MHTKKSPSALLLEAVRHLYATIDGVDGYECESGCLRYWIPEKIEAARAFLDAMDDSGLLKEALHEADGLARSNGNSN